MNSLDGFLELREHVQGESSLISNTEYYNKFSEKFKQKPNSDWYRSLYLYNNSMKLHYDHNKSVKGYKGGASASYLFFDLDNNDLEKAKQDTKLLLKKLCEVANIKKEELIKHVKIYFSGNKGFHVFFYTIKRNNPEEMKTLCKQIAGDIESFDSVIYNTTRIIRIENTRHQKSNLYKIELKTKQLNLSVEEIKKLAEKPSTINSNIIPFNSNSFKIAPEAPKSIVVASTDIEGVRGLKTIDFARCPKNWPRCIYAMTKGIMVPGVGERHSIFLALTRFFRNQGYDTQHTHRLLKGVAELNHALYPETDLYDKETIWHECVQSVYDDKDNKFLNNGSWGIDPKKDEIFIRYCKLLDNHTSTKCCMHNRNDKIKTIFTTKDMIKGYKTDFARSYKKSIIQTGMNFIDQDLEIRKRTVTLIVGSAGSGKTSKALKILENCNNLGIHSVFFCMDMDMYSIVEKLGEKHTPYKKSQFREIFRKEQEGEKLTEKEAQIIQEVEEQIEKNYSNTIFDYSATLTMDELRDRVLELEEETGNKIGMVLVDYASRITSHLKNDYDNQKYNALKSKEIAQVTDAAWIYLCQTSRNSGDSHIPLRTKRAAKGAGDWEEVAQNVITVWRPFAGMHGVIYEDEAGGSVEFNDNFMRVYLAKNRMGIEKELVLNWKPQDGILEELSPEDSSYYRDEIEPLEKLALKYKIGKKFSN